MRRAACIAQGLIRRVLSGSKEELEDLKQAYADTSGSIADIMTHIPHSTFDDEVRFIVAISDLIQRGDLPSLPQWESSTKDDKAKLVRKKQAAKEAADASALAEDGDKLCLRLRARNENLVLDFGGVTGTNSAVDGLRRGMAGI